MRARLLMGLLGGGTAWALHLAGSYLLVALGCARGWPTLGLLLGLLTLAGAAGAVGAGVVWSLGQRGEPVRPLPGAVEPGESARFVASIGARLAGLFAFMIVLAGAAPLVLWPCAGP